MPPTRRSRAQTQIRRFRFWLSGFRWWAVLAATLTLVTVAAVVLDRPIEQIAGFGLAGIAFAVLSLKESP